MFLTKDEGESVLPGLLNIYVFRAQIKLKLVILQHRKL